LADLDPTLLPPRVWTSAAKLTEAIEKLANDFGMNCSAREFLDFADAQTQLMKERETKLTEDRHIKEIKTLNALWTAGSTKVTIEPVSCFEMPAIARVPRLRMVPGPRTIPGLRTVPRLRSVPGLRTFPDLSSELDGMLELAEAETECIR